MQECGAQTCGVRNQLPAGIKAKHIGLLSLRVLELSAVLPTESYKVRRNAQLLTSKANAPVLIVRVPMCRS